MAPKLKIVVREHPHQGPPTPGASPLPQQPLKVIETLTLEPHPHDSVDQRHSKVMAMLQRKGYRVRSLAHSLTGFEAIVWKR